MNHSYRLRHNWRGKLILQIGLWVDLNEYRSGYGYWQWRDATVKDISMYTVKGMGLA